MTSYADSIVRINDYRRKIQDLHEDIRAVQAEIEPQPVENYSFSTSNGPVRLADLFGTKNDLFVIHNMGKGCVYCTMWADGFNGVYDHLSNRAAFALTSPDAPAVQREFAASRGWRFPSSATPAQVSPRIWGTGKRTAKFCPAFLRSAACRRESHVSRTQGWGRMMISARSGIF